jgi:hypothetical protein
MRNEYPSAPNHTDTPSKPADQRGNTDLPPLHHPARHARSAQRRALRGTWHQSRYPSCGKRAAGRRSAVVVGQSDAAQHEPHWDSEPSRSCYPYAAVVSRARMMVWRLVSYCLASADTLAPSATVRFNARHRVDHFRRAAFCGSRRSSAGSTPSASASRPTILRLAKNTPFSSVTSCA